MRADALLLLASSEVRPMAPLPLWERGWGEGVELRAGFIPPPHPSPLPPGERELVRMGRSFGGESYGHKKAPA